MAVNQTIGKFIQVASSKDFARDNLFRIMQLSCRNLTLSEDDLVYAKGGKIPGRVNPLSDNVKYMGMKLPYTKSTVEYPGNDDYEIEFYLDKNSDLAKKFERASRITFNDLSTTGDWRFPDVSDLMTVAALDINLEPIEYITFYGISFTKFDDIEFKVADSSGEALSIKAHFSYLYYKREGSDTVYTGNKI
jgi:hypothetical protein